MDKNNDADPRPGIRAVFLAGFFGGNASGLLYLTLAGYLLESLWFNPLALFGAFIGIGLVGMMIGAIVGFSLRLLLGEQESKDNWRIPVVVAGLASSAWGLLIAHTLVAMVFQMVR